MAVGKPQRLNRETPRLPDYDYTQPGAYFVTVCAYRRWSMFGQIVDGKMRPNALGKLVDGIWREIPGHFSVVDLDASVVMPNHFHAVVMIKDPATEADWRARAERIPFRESFGQPFAASLLPSFFIHGGGQTRSGAPLHLAQPVWHPRYYEHVFRNDRTSNGFATTSSPPVLLGESDHDNPNRKP